jgi:hypothetical protein
MDLLAYIDPGSGSLLLQALIAGLLAIPFFFRRTIGGAIDRLRGRKPEASASDATPTEPAGRPADGHDRSEP